MSYLAKRKFDVDNKVTLKGSPTNVGGIKEYNPHFLTMIVKITDSGGVRFEYDSDNVHKTFSFSSKPTIIGAHNIDKWIDKIYDENDLK